MNITKTGTLLFTFTILLCLSIRVYSQDYINSDGKEELIVGASEHYGWVVIHHPSFANLITGHTSAFEVNVGKQTVHKNSWNEHFRYPTIGISYFFADLGNPAQLGYVDALYAWINFPLVRSKIYTMGFRLGTGLGYITKRFDRLEDYKDEVIGSHINGLMHVSYTNTFKLSNQLSLFANIGITHLSNGSYKTPNLGINIATESIGLSYRFGKDTIHFPKHKERQPFNDRKIFLNIVAAGGAKEILPPDHQKYFVYSFSGSCLKKLGYKSSLGLGLDYLHDASLKKLMQTDSSFFGKNPPVGTIGIYAAHDLAINKVHIVMDLGYYLYRKWKTDGSVYDRIGYKYFFTNNICFNLTMETHWAKADFLECGFGYKF
jgi:hypothetical protein